MADNGNYRGVTGKLEIIFAIPTDDPSIWRAKRGSLTYANGATAGIEVDGGYIPHSGGNYGLTVTFFTVRNIRQAGSQFTGEIDMTTCLNGRVMDVSDIASGVEVIPPPGLQEAFASYSQAVAG